jgi:hypothetical protein
MRPERGGGRDRTGPEVRLVGDLLAHIEQRSADCDARLARLERERAAAPRSGGATSDGRLRRLGTEAATPHAEVSRLHVSATLVQAYLRLRREQLAQAPGRRPASAAPS